jgi:hypothetical protein
MEQNMKIKGLVLTLLIVAGMIFSMIITVSAVTFDEWLPFELSVTSLIWFLLVLGIAIAGGSAGIAAKHYQSKNWKFAPEDLVYYLLVISASVLFFITATPAEQIFIYSASLNGGLGILRNMVDKRDEKK